MLSMQPKIANWPITETESAVSEFHSLKLAISYYRDGAVRVTVRVTVTGLRLGVGVRVTVRSG